MKKIILLSAAMMLGITLSAQIPTQQGYVKTKGRMVNGKLVPGKGLKGATVSIKGRTAVLVKSDDGAFSFPVTEQQFLVDSVRKKGYQLVDMDACPKTYNYSNNPLYIVMEMPEQQLQDRLDAETKIRHNLQNQLIAKEKEIEGLREQNKITLEEYQQAMQRLFAAQSSNEKLISDMAKRYSELDYDQLDEFYRQVSYCIENGELVKADSLLRTKGNPTEQAKELMQKGQAIKEQEEQLNQAKTVYSSDIDELARRCYSYYETFAAQHMNDTAAYYLELRASLDTTNFEWSDDASEHLLHYLGHYDNALTYAYRSLRNAIAQYGEKNEKVAKSYNRIGEIYRELGQYTKALNCYDIALDIVISSIGTNNATIASIYNNIGLGYSEIGDYEKAMYNSNKALTIKKEILGENHPSLLYTYTNIGCIYYGKGWYKTALEYFQKALSLFDDVGSIEYATVLSNLGRCYDKIGEFDKGLKYIEEALEYREKLLGPKHPSVAFSYCDLGNHYKMQGDYSKALKYTEKAIQALTIVLNRNHPDIAEAYQKLGGIYLHTAQFELALKYYNEALSIKETLYGRENKYTAVSIADLGYYYYSIEDFEKAMAYYFEALHIFETTIGTNNTDVINCHNTIGEMYGYLGDYSKAIEHTNTALAIATTINENEYDIAHIYNSLGFIYYYNDDISKSLEAFNKSLELVERAYGQEHPDVATAYHNIGYIYNAQGNYEKALQYLKTALTIRLKVHHGENHHHIASSYHVIGNVYFDLGNYEKALEYYNQALPIRENALGSDHPDTIKLKDKINEVQAKLKEQEK